MKTAKVKIPEGFEIEKVDHLTGDVTFKPVPVNMRTSIKGLNDIFAYHKTTKAEFDKKYGDREPYEYAGKLEELIAAAYNQGVKPNWSDGEPKGILVFKMDESPSGGGFSLVGVDRWCSSSHVGARLVFTGADWKENALDAAKKFLDIYKQSRTY